MTMPQGPQSEQPPSGSPEADHATQVFAAPGRVPQDPPPQGLPAGGPQDGPYQGPPQDRQFPGAPPQSQPTRQREASQGLPAQGPPPQAGSHQGPPPQSQPTRQREASQGLPAQGPPPQAGSHQGPPPGRPPEGPDRWTSGPPSPGQFGAPSHVGAPRPQSANAIWLLGLVSLLAVVCGLSISEDGQNAWHTVHAWGGLAILGSLLTLATVAAGGNLRPARAWQVAACGAGALVLYWVLFVLPAVGSNTSLVTTIGVAAGAVAVWIAPGREAAERSASVRSDAARPPEHTW